VARQQEDSMSPFGNLQQALGGQQQQQEYQDFANRYEQGAPSEGYSDQEVTQRYQQVAQHLPPQAYQQAAQQSFERMTPQDRQQFGQALQQQAQQQGINVQGMGESNFQDPSSLAQMTTQVHQQQPGLLAGLLGGGGGQPMGDQPMGDQQFAGQQLGGMQGGQTWQTLDSQTREIFTRQWGDRAQQEWEQENAQNMGGGAQGSGAQGGGMGSMLGSPVAKAAMAGIAAMAVKNMLSGR